jgi:hypothetical protein
MVGASFGVELNTGSRFDREKPLSNLRALYVKRMDRAEVEVTPRPLSVGWEQ